jgi:hypothetical protein
MNAFCLALGHYLAIAAIELIMDHGVPALKQSGKPARVQ